jgi:thioredoxin 1
MEVEINKDNYQEVVVAPGIPTVVDFWGPQCTRCFALMPAIEGLAQENEGRLRLIKIDASKNRRLCINLRLMSLPSFLFYSGGKEVERLTGDSVTPKDLRGAVERLLAGQGGGQ